MNLDKILTGKTDDHVKYVNQHVAIHQKMVKDFNKLKEKALKQKINLQIASGYRNFDRQKTIWIEKIEGKRKIYDHEGIHTISPQKCSPQELIFYVLRWSALPGMSRHHWGTDIDIFDSDALANGQKLELIPEEYDRNGPMASLYNWLKEEVETSFKNKFYFPYDVQKKGGVANEKWHLSYIPLASFYEESYTYQFFTQYLHESSLLYKEILIENSSKIYEIYFKQYFSFT